jgi:hypothetical protein
MRQFEWPLTTVTPESKLLIPKIDTFGASEFPGLYGYNDTFTQMGFLGQRFFVIETQRRGQDVVYLFDTESK